MDRKKSASGSCSSGGTMTQCGDWCISLGRGVVLTGWWRRGGGSFSHLSYILREQLGIDQPIEHPPPQGNRVLSWLVRGLRPKRGEKTSGERDVPCATNAANHFGTHARGSAWIPGRETAPSFGTGQLVITGSCQVSCNSPAPVHWGAGRRG